MPHDKSGQRAPAEEAHGRPGHARHGFTGGGLVGFALGYVIAGEGRSNPHGGLILVALLMFGGAILGLIVGAVAAYRVGRRVT